MTGRITLNPTSWPIWLKLLVGFTLALLALILPTAVLLRAGIAEVGIQNARAYVSENGARQLAALSSSITQAQDTLDRFLADPANRRILEGALVGDIITSPPLNLPSGSTAQIEALLDSSLLNAATTPYENVRLLDRNGQVIARANLAGRADTGSTDESRTPAYRAIQSARLQGQTRTLSIEVSGFPTLDYITSIVWRDGRTLGYLVARLSNARVLYANLRYNDATYPAYSFLTTSQNQLIAPSDVLTVQNAASSETIVSRALLGQSGTDVYTVSTGTEVVGYFTPVRGTPLVLISQLPASAAFQRALDFFNLRIFVVGVGVVALIAVFVVAFTQVLVPPINRLRKAAQQVGEGNYAVPIADARRGDEIGALANALLNLRDSVKVRVEDLESRLASRGRDIAATQDIGRYAATQRDLQALMNRVVDLIVERFPTIYHAQIFLIDKERQYAIVRASTGEVGQQLLARGHRLAVGSISVIGQVTEQGRVIIARDTAVSQIHRRNEFLPETRAELAVPLRIGDQIIGALDVQSKERDAFTDDLTNVLQTMADQIAIAIENARLYEESVRRVIEIEESNRAATARAWQEYMRELRQRTLSKDAGVRQIAGGTETAAASELRQQALRTGQPAVGKLTGRDTIPVALPIILRGQTLGAVEWELPSAGFGPDKLELARELANRLAVSLDNARLFQESQRATERERIVNTIAAKLTAQTSIETILQTAVREVGQALRAPQVSIRLRAHGLAENGGNGSHPAGGNGNGNGNGHMHHGGSATDDSR
ncbi:GAF domain-containing protein [Anaerolineae bacterium CFX9]|nr:GAF domain-containing protein [Anaerolineae bacterium CFX9]